MHASPTLRTAARPALVLLALGLAAPAALAGKKNKKKDAAPADAPAAEAAPDTPGDAASVKFGKRLLEANISNFRPSDAGGAKFLYTSLRFQADNTWKAEGYVEIDDERMECVETGKWSMEPAESDKVAVVAWSVDKTDCAGRDAGASLRAKVSIAKDGSVKTEWR